MRARLFAVIADLQVVEFDRRPRERGAERRGGDLLRRAIEFEFRDGHRLGIEELRNFRSRISSRPSSAMPSPLICKSMKGSSGMRETRPVTSAFVFPNLTSHRSIASEISDRSADFLSDLAVRANSASSGARAGSTPSTNQIG